MDCEELYISYFFPPSNQASGIVTFKRIIENGRKVDVLQGDFKKSDEEDDFVGPYINERIQVSVDGKFDWADFIFKFMDRGLKAIDDDYKRIYSRSWLMANHFLACEYKFKHPGVTWTAEFSDPLIFDLNNQPKTYKQMIIDDEIYITRLNNEIKNLGEEFPLIENKSSAYFIAEYLVYLFADAIIFTNENQRKVMLDQFPIDIRDHVMEKSEIKPHPTIPDEFYHIRDVDLQLDEDCLNVAYFGNDYYSKRHFEGLFYAVESLKHKYRDNVRIHIFSANDGFVKRLVPSDGFIVKKPLEYLDFLNATTKFDVLIVNDVNTKGNYEVNPYLPSKLSDYKGSGSDIWAIYEKGSSLSRIDVKYRSDMADYDECSSVFRKILEDYGFHDRDATVDKGYINDRLTDFNELYEKQFKENLRLKRQIRKIKKENEELKTSTSWKITKPLRKIRK